MPNSEKGGDDDKVSLGDIDITAIVGKTIDTETISEEEEGSSLSTHRGFHIEIYNPDLDGNEEKTGAEEQGRVGKEQPISKEKRLLKDSRLALIKKLAPTPLVSADDSVKSEEDQSVSGEILNDDKTLSLDNGVKRGKDWRSLLSNIFASNKRGNIRLGGLVQKDSAVPRTIGSGVLENLSSLYHYGSKGQSHEALYTSESGLNQKDTFPSDEVLSSLRQATTTSEEDQSVSGEILNDDKTLSLDNGVKRGKDWRSLLSNIFASNKRGNIRLGGLVQKDSAVPRTIGSGVLENLSSLASYGYKGQSHKALNPSEIESDLEDGANGGVVFSPLHNQETGSQNNKSIDLLLDPEGGNHNTPNNTFLQDPTTLGALPLVVQGVPAPLSDISTPGGSPTPPLAINPLKKMIVETSITYQRMTEGGLSENRQKLASQFTAEHRSKEELVFFKALDSENKPYPKADFSAASSDFGNENGGVRDVIKNKVCNAIGEAAESSGLLKALSDLGIEGNKATALVAAIVLIAHKNDGIGGNEKMKQSLLRDLGKFCGDLELEEGGIETIQKAAIKFSKAFQDKMLKNSIFTGNTEADNLVGMRLKRVDPDFVLDYLDTKIVVGTEGVTASDTFKDVCNRLDGLDAIRGGAKSRDRGVRR